MALRFTVQGDDEAETAAGLAWLLAHGLTPTLPPRQVTDDRWIAKTAPTAKAPDAECGRGPGVGG
jgi:hypothetical protein